MDVLPLRRSRRLRHLLAIKHFGWVKTRYSQILRKMQHQVLLLEL